MLIAAARDGRFVSVTLYSTAFAKLTMARELSCIGASAQCVCLRHADTCIGVVVQTTDATTELRIFTCFTSVYSRSRQQRAPWRVCSMFISFSLSSL